MATRQEILIEANRRGLLTGQQKTSFDEAVSRGIIQIPQQTAPSAQSVQQQAVPVQPAAQPQQDATTQRLERILEARKSGAGQGQDISDLLSGIESRIVEPAVTIASGTPATIAGGVAGTVQALNPLAAPGAGAEAVESVSRALTIEPKTTEGQESLQRVSGAVEAGIEAIPDVIKDIPDIVLEETGSPLAATIVRTIPEAVLARLGVKRGPRGAPDISPQRAREIEQAISAGEARGVDVLTSDIFQPKSILSRLSQQFSERIPVFGVGGRRGKQQQNRIEALDALDETTPRVEAADIFDSLNKSANKVRTAAGKRINNVIEQMDQFGDVSVSNTINSIDQSLARLTRPGKIQNKGLIDDLENLKTTAQDAGGSFNSLREFRTDTRAIVDAVDPAGRSQLRSTDKVLMERVISGITKDLDSFVGNNSTPSGLSKYKAADKIYAQEATKLTKSRLKNVLDKGDVKPELVNNLLFSSAPSEVKLLFKNLDSGGRQNARMALYRRALDNATKGGEISPQRFASELDKMRGNFEVFFRGNDRAEFQGLKRLLETTKRAGEAGVVGPTGQALQLPATTAAIGGAAFGDPTAIATILLASTVGAGARIFESSGVRNMLIRLGKSPKRSTLEADLVKTIPLILEQSAQGLRQEQQVTQTPSESP